MAMENKDRSSQDQYIPQVYSSSDSIDARITTPIVVSMTVSANKVTLIWSPVSGASSYVVEASNSVTTGFHDLSSYGSFSTVGSNVKWSENYATGYHFYRVKAIAANTGNMVYVAGGTFNNGSANMTVSSFYIEKYEITSSEFYRVMGFNRNYFTNVVNGPANQVLWVEAIEYCNRRSMLEGLTPCYSYLTYGTNPNNWPSGWDTAAHHTNISCNWSANGYRLPTEMESWFAARGGNQTHNYNFSGSNNFDAVGWYNGNSGGTTHPIGLKAPNELGLYDMSGNVFEWVWDIYGSYPTTPQTNYTGPTSGSERVMRGCSWYCSPYCYVSFRESWSPASVNYLIGFRVCRKGN